MNIKTVARRANVSTATVSRTINGSEKVAADTAARVKSAIRALNFIPNINARALGSGRSSLLGLIISDLTNPFFPELVKTFSDLASQRGKEVLVANTDYDPQRTVHCVRRMLERKVDGVAILTSEVDDHLVDLFRRSHTPVVFLDSGIPAKGISCIRIDYSVGTDLAMKHLTALGHTRIGFISGPTTLKSAQARHRAFRESAARNFLPSGKELVQEGNYRPAGGHDAMLRLLQMKHPPTAVLASNDLTAIGALGAIAERGLRVPQDISLIGFDDIFLSAFTSPPLTTVRLPYTRIAHAAIDSLLGAQPEEGKSLKQGDEHIIPPIFQDRSTTAPPPSNSNSARSLLWPEGTMV